LLRDPAWGRLAAVLDGLSIKREYWRVLVREEIDEAALKFSTDADLKDLELPKGVRMKLLKWIQAHAAAQESSGSSGSSERSSGGAFVGGSAGGGRQRDEGEPLGAQPGAAGDAPPKVPDTFCCPISTFIMEDPCTLGGDGQTYERRDIAAWLQRSRTSPLTGAALVGPAALQLAPNAALRRAIAEWAATNGYDMAM
jgi:hypothetical protein